MTPASLTYLPEKVQHCRKNFLSVSTKTCLQTPGSPLFSQRIQKTCNYKSFLCSFEIYLPQSRNICFKDLEATPLKCNHQERQSLCFPISMEGQDSNFDKYQLAKREALITLINLPRPPKFPSILFLQHTPAFKIFLLFVSMELSSSYLKFLSYFSSLNKIYLATLKKCPVLFLFDAIN